MITRMIHSNAKKCGFTLLEMLVSLAIFMIVAVFAVGALVRITGLNRQAQTLQSSMTNISFALETMSREMRVGSNFKCLSDATNWVQNGTTALTNNLSSAFCPIVAASPASGTSKARLIAFQSSNNIDTSCNNYLLVHAYAFVPSGTSWKLEEARQTTCRDVISYPDSFSSILDDANITLTGYELGAYANSTSPYAWIFVRVKGLSGVRTQDQNSFDIQTSISQRISDL